MLANPADMASPEELQVGTWDMSHWGAEKVTAAAAKWRFDVLLAQETHVVAVPLERWGAAAPLSCWCR